MCLRFLSTSLDRMKIGGDEHTLRELSPRGQLPGDWAFPSTILHKCPPELQAEQMNHWIKNEKREQLFIRFDDQEVRAIFTPRYKPVDNFEVLARLDEMGYTPDTQVQCHHDAEFMLLSIPDGKRSFKINGDKMTPGISISNSEVGLASLSVSAFILRLVCTNGMVAKTEISASYRHVSTKILTELAPGVRESGRWLGQTEGSLEIVPGEPSCRSPHDHREFQSSVCPWGDGKISCGVGMATGSWGDHVSCGEHVYPSCCHGGVAGGVELSVAEGRRRGAGDVEMTGNICPFWEGGGIL